MSDEITTQEEVLEPYRNESELLQIYETYHTYQYFTDDEIDRLLQYLINAKVAQTELEIRNNLENIIEQSVSAACEELRQEYLQIQEKQLQYDTKKLEVTLRTVNYG